MRWSNPSLLVSSDSLFSFVPRPVGMRSLIPHNMADTQQRALAWSGGLYHLPDSSLVTWLLFGGPSLIVFPRGNCLMHFHTRLQDTDHQSRSHWICGLCPVCWNLWFLQQKGVSSLPPPPFMGWSAMEIAFSGREAAETGYRYGGEPEARVCNAVLIARQHDRDFCHLLY